MQRVSKQGNQLLKVTRERYATNYDKLCMQTTRADKRGMQCSGKGKIEVSMGASCQADILQHAKRTKTDV